MDRTVVELNDICFRWRREEPAVLDIAHFSVVRGERLFIKGPSGSGKTTLLNLLAGMVVPERGRVSILGTEIQSVSGARRDAFRAAHVGFIFQMFNLVPYLSLIDNVLLPCRFSEVRRARTLERAPTLDAAARRLLEHMALDVDALGERPVTQLSTGQQQRVAAARALIGAPEIVIADEPTSALDSDRRLSFLDLLFREIEAEDATLLFVSHDASLQERFDRSVELAAINRETAEP